MLTLVDIDLLKPHEDICRHAMMALLRKIQQEGCWSYPVIIDADSFIIMDGHHRYYAAKQLQLSKIPCYLMNYQSEQVEIFHWQTNQMILAQEIIAQVQQGKCYERKTTRHVFKNEIASINIKLTELI